jgi:hypothetical protein
MPRPRKNDPSSLLRPLLDDFARQLAAAVEAATYARVGQLIADLGGARRARRGANGGTRAAARCYYPGCKNVAAPRFGMFCAALHKNLSRAEKDKYRAQHRA